MANHNIYTVDSVLNNCVNEIIIIITIMQVLKAIFIGIYGSIIMTLYYKL